MNNIYYRMMKFPFTYIIYITSLFAIGISLAFLLKNIFIAYISIFISFILIITGLILSIKKIYSIFPLFLSCIFIGYSYTAMKYYNNFTNSINDISKNTKAFSASIKRYDGIFGFRKRYVASVNEVFDGTNWTNTGGNIRLYNNTQKALYINDRIIVFSGFKLYKNILTNENEKYDNEAIIKNLENKMIYGVSSIYRNNDFFIEKDGFSIFNYIDKYSSKLRYFIKEALGKYMNPINYSVAQCIVLGDKSILPYDIQKIFINAGIAHILAVSGLHVSMFIFIITFFLSFIPINFYKKIILSLIIVLLIYPPVTLYSVSVLRASIMALCITISLYFDRSKNSINALFLAALIILISEPNSIKDISFQFSSLATLGILLYYPIYDITIAKIFQNKKAINYFCKSIFISLSALIITLPLSVYYFSVLNLTSILSNIVAIPISFIILLSSFLTILIYAIFPPIAVYMSGSSEVFTELLITTAKIFSNIKILRYDLICNFTTAITMTIIIILTGFYFRRKIGVNNL